MSFNVTVECLDHISLGALGDSFYEYLLKSWIQSNKTDTNARQMYDSAMLAMINNNIIQTSSGGLIYATDLRYNRFDHRMGHLACFAGEFAEILLRTVRSQGLLS